MSKNTAENLIYILKTRHFLCVSVIVIVTTIAIYYYNKPVVYDPPFVPYSVVCEGEYTIDFSESLWEPESLTLKKKSKRIYIAEDIYNSLYRNDANFYGKVKKFGHRMPIEYHKSNDRAERKSLLKKTIMKPHSLKE